MLLRTILLGAFLVAPLASLPPSVSAQETGLDRAATVSATGDVAPGVAKHAAAKRPMALPAGVAKNFDGGTLPPGMSRAFPGTTGGDDTGDAGDAAGSDDGGSNEVCINGVLYVNGIPMRGC